MKHPKKVIAVCAALVCFPLVGFAGDSPLDPSYQKYKPQTRVGVEVDANATATGTVIQIPVATTNAGNISANGGQLNVGPGAISPTANGGSVALKNSLNPTASAVANGGQLNVGAGALSPTANGGQATANGGKANATIGNVAGGNSTNTIKVNGGTQSNTLNVARGALTANGGEGGEGGKGGNATSTTGPINVQGGNTTSTAIIAPNAVNNHTTATGGKGGNATSNATATVAPGAVQNHVAGGTGSVKDSGNSSVKDSGNSSSTVAGSGNSEVSNNGNIATGAVQVNVDNRQQNPAPPHAVATTPGVLQINPQAVTSSFSLGLPNAVGAAGFTHLYQRHCQTQMSGEKNVIRFQTKYEQGIAALDDQALQGNSKVTPTVHVTPDQPTNPGRCFCLGTLQVELRVDPDLLSKGNEETVHAAAGKWLRDNIRGFKFVDAIYSDKSTTYPKVVEGAGWSKGIGGGGSATFGNNMVGIITPSFGNTQGYSRNHALVTVKYALVGSNGNDTPVDGRTLDVSEFMKQVAALPAVEQWGAVAATPIQVIK